MSDQPPRTIEELVAMIEAHRMLAHTAYCVVTVDQHDGSVVNVTGLWPDSLSALAHIQRTMLPEDEKIKDPDGTGWDHHVVPFFPVEDERP